MGQYVSILKNDKGKKETEKEEEEEEDPAVPSMEPPPAVIMGAVYERWGRLLGCDPYRGGGKKADGRISGSRQLLPILIEFGQRYTGLGTLRWAGEEMCLLVSSPVSTLSSP